MNKFLLLLLSFCFLQVQISLAQQDDDEEENDGRVKNGQGYKPSPMKPTIYTEYSYKDLGKAAKNENKVYVLFVSDPACINCRTVDSLMNNSKEIKSLVDKYFLVNQFDASNFANLYKATNWGVQGVPSFVFFSPKGKILEIVESKKTHKELLDMYTTIIKKMMDQNNAYNPNNYQKNKK